MRTILTYRIPEEIKVEGKSQESLTNEVTRLLYTYLKSGKAVLKDVFHDYGPKDNPDDVFMPIDNETDERLAIVDVVKMFDYDFDIAEFHIHELQINEKLLEQLSSHQMVLENYWISSEGNIVHAYFNLGPEI